MGEIVKLGKARKARKQAEERRQAAENRVRFGRTRAGKAADAAAGAKRDALLDGTRREGEQEP